MVLTGTAVQSEYPSLSYKIKIKQPLMDPGPGLVSMPRNRRVELPGPSGPNISNATNCISSTSGTTFTTDSNTATSTVQPTAHQQKIRRNQGDQQLRWQDRGQKPLKTSSGHPYVVNNYSIVASRGELARNSFCEPTTKKKGFLSNGKVLSVENRRQSPVQGRRGSRETEKDSIRSRNTKNKQDTIKKSASVPANLKGLSGREKLPCRVPEEGIVKRSSSFLANLTSGKFSSDRKYATELQNGATLHSVKVQNSTGFREDEKYLSSALKRYSFSLPTRKNSSSTRSLSKELIKTSGSTKKSVSFRSDTAFEEKKSNYQRTAIHEAKVYKKGVLQDRLPDGESAKTVTPLGEAPPGGPQALLRAAREADDEVLRKIVMRVEKFGLGDIDVNSSDSSGRTAISYMAGNGATTILEAALSFSGIDPNMSDNEGNTPLHFAAQAGQIDCLNILLQRCPGIKVDVRNNLGFTPLMKAALQGRTKCAKVLLFAGANPTLRDHGRGLRAEQWARFCGRYVCAEVIERFARHRLMEKTTSCRWGSEPELAVRVLQGKVTPIPTNPLPQQSMGLRSRIKRVFRTTSGPDRSFSLVTQLTSAALCASSPVLPKPGDVPPVVKSLLRPLSVPQLRITLVAPPEVLDRTTDKCVTNFSEKIENTIVKPPRAKKKSK